MDTLMSDSQVQTVEDWNRLLQNSKMSFSNDMATVWNKVNSDYLLQIRYVYPAGSLSLCLFGYWNKVMYTEESLMLFQSVHWLNYFILLDLFQCFQ